MKTKLLFAFLTMVICWSSNAQVMVSKGSLLGSGALSFSSGKIKHDDSGSTSTEKFTDFQISPWAAYFILDNLGVGANVNISSNKTSTSGSPYSVTQNGVTIGPIVRYYVAKGPFVQGYFGVGSSKSKSTGFTTIESKQNVTEWYGGAGYSVRLSDTILLDPLVGYRSSSAKLKNQAGYKDVTSEFFIQIGFTIYLISK